MHAAIRQTKLKPGSADEVIQKAREGALPLITATPGFKAYYMVLGEDNSLTTVSVFEDKASAEKSNAQVMAWIKQNMGPYVAAPTQATEGRVALHKP